jgi:hypothetical protein
VTDASTRAPSAGASHQKDSTDRARLRTAVRLVDRETFVILALAGYAVVLLGVLTTSFVSDSWLMLVSGREIAAHGLPDRDTLTAWTAGREWVDQQWLAQIGAYGLQRVAGAGGLVLAGAAAAVCALALAAAGARRLGGSARSTALVALLCAPALLPFTAIRPQTFAYPLFVGLFVLLETSPRRLSPKVLLCLPILVLWANVHGSVVLGAALVTLWAFTRVFWGGGRLRLDEAWLHYAGVVAASWLCLLATPYTVGVVGYYRRILFSSAFGDVVTEWMRPSFPRALPFFVVAGLALLLVFTPRPRYSLFARTSLALTAFAGFTALRHTAWLPLLVATLAPLALDAIRQPRDVERHVPVNLTLVAAGVAGVAVVAVLALLKSDASYERPLRAEVVRVVGREADRTGGPVFADSVSADWLLWHDPDLKRRIAFDVRFELLTEAELRRLGAFWDREGESWRSAADCCPVLVLRTKDDVTRTLRRELRVAYADDSTTVLVRR